MFVTRTAVNFSDRSPHGFSYENILLMRLFMLIAEYAELRHCRETSAVQPQRLPYLDIYLVPVETLWRLTETSALQKPQVCKRWHIDA